ncbi:hypothetical protein IFM5058_10923 [Aspergillus udagawae]|nr:hypothetical protein IFM5058_10923 [Aspergillus udagawae]
MLLAPSNDVVNDLTVRIEEAWLQFIPDRETIVVHYHALGTKEDLLLMPVKKQRPHLVNARPPIIAEDDSTCDDSLLAQVALAQMLFKFQQAQTAQPLGVKDRWVKQSWELCDAVLAHADAIICTLHATGEQAICDNVQPQAILVDEAARATEPELWPALAFFNPNVFILISDHHQLYPLLHRNGLHAVMLMEQHQMHESMAQMVSSVFYNGELWMSRAMADQTCELARQVNRFNCRTFWSPGQMLFLDVKDSFDHCDAQQHSYLNMAHRRVAAALVICLLTNQVADPAVITVLTLYQAQLWEYQALFAILHQQQPTLQLYLVQVKTIDSFQGRELSVVVLDLTVVSSLGFMREGNYLNVALS